MVSIVSSGLNRLGNHPLKENFNRHCVCTAVMRHKEFTVTIKYTAIKGYMVIIIVTMKSKIKLVEEEAISLFSIALGLFSLADHSVIHSLISFQDWKIKKHAKTHVLFS